VEVERQNWMDQRRKLKSFDTLSQRHRLEQKHHESRRDQKAQDEFALRRFSGRMALGQGGLA
jgi:flagellar protein FliJ